MIDWFRIISDLQKNKISMSKLSKLLGVSERTIANWKCINEPKFSDGTKIISIWCQVTNKNQSELPIKKV